MIVSCLTTSQDSMLLFFNWISRSRPSEIAPYNFIERLSTIWIHVGIATDDENAISRSPTQEEEEGPDDAAARERKESKRVQHTASHSSLRFGVFFVLLCSSPLGCFNRGSPIVPHLLLST